MFAFVREDALRKGKERKRRGAPFLISASNERDVRKWGTAGEEAHETDDDFGNHEWEKRKGGKTASSRCPNDKWLVHEFLRPTHVVDHPKSAKMQFAKGHPWNR